MPTDIPFETRIDYAVGGQPSGIGLGDFNGDGRPDLAVACAADANW
jgi:hypothetical protein